LKRVHTLNVSVTGTGTGAGCKAHNGCSPITAGSGAGIAAVGCAGCAGCAAVGCAGCVNIGPVYIVAISHSVGSPVYNAYTLCTITPPTPITTAPVSVIPSNNPKKLLFMVVVVCFLYILLPTVCTVRTIWIIVFIYLTNQRIENLYTHLFNAIILLKIFL
jgi:hypothetical protein